MRQQYRDWGVRSRHIIRSRYFGICESSRINMEYGAGARGSLLKRCQEPHFNYCIRYSLQIWRAYRYGGVPYSKVVIFTERQPHIHIWAPYRLNMEPPYSIWSCNQTIPYIFPFYLLLASNKNRILCGLYILYIGAWF